MNIVLHFLRSTEAKFKRDKEFSRRFTLISTITVLLVSISLMFPGGRAMQFADLKEGSISTRRILAPYDFEILKTEEEYRHDQEEAARKVSRVFNRMDHQAETATARIDTLFEEIRRCREQVRRSPETRRAIADTLFSAYSLTLDTSVKDALLRTGSRIPGSLLTRLREKLKNVVRDHLTVGVYDVEKPGPGQNSKMAVNVDGVENIYEYDDFFHISDARKQAFNLLKSDADLPEELLVLGYSVIDMVLRPNIRPDDEITEQRRQQIKARVPSSSGLIFEKELIVDENERITLDIRKKLDSLASKMSEKGSDAGGIHRILPIAGRLGFVLFILYIFSVFINLDDPEILKDNKSLILIGLVILLISILTFVLREIGGSEYFIPVAMGAMLLSILYDTKLGYIAAAVLAVLCGGLWGGEFGVTVAAFLTGVAGVVTTRQIRSRGQLVRMVIALVGAYLFIITVTGFMQMTPFSQIAGDWVFGALSGLLIPVVTYGLIPLVESAFGFTTDFSLLELSNLNHPLLKQLSTTAPGTYHHSIIVGSLAEAGAQATSANSLVARVGSYYHDIGKLEKEEYFIENQLPGEQPHARLNPSMSALVLMNHVKKGVEFAKKYKLPKAIIDTIAQHHGTTLISFFYNKALNTENAGDVHEEDYRYAGPRPQTKETAIVMLADAVEAASRALKKPTHARLKGLVDDIIDGRFQERQLDQSPLTLRDLEKIKESFLTILAGIFHARIEYPEKEEK
ncbi:HDIG domain-containing protein [bacterium]|nr:HDIG domain-containing protein [bacterium]